jgi:hypothetical protein
MGVSSVVERSDGSGAALVVSVVAITPLYADALPRPGIKLEYQNSTKR